MALVLCLAAGTARADLTCRAEVDRRTVAQYDQIVLTVEAEGDAGWSADFNLPELPDIRVQGGGTNQSMVFANGQTVTTLSRTYYLQIETDSDFTIGPVEIRTNGGVCQTDPIAIKVTAADSGGPPATSPPGGSGTTGRTAPQDGDSRRTARNPAGQPGDDIFISLDVDHREAWVGQQIILTFRYYRRIQPWNNPSYQPPRAEGFWREALGPERDFRRIVSGRSYNVTEIRYALFPTRAGDLTIEPAELTFREDVFDRFFNSRRRTGPRVFRTDPITVQVRDLPQPAPDGFQGLVATDVSLDVTTDKVTVPRGEPLGWKIKLVSDGFLKGFDGLVIPDVESARTHEAGDSFKSSVGEQLTSEVTVDRVLVPTEEGTLTIPDVTVPWFDADAGRYRTARGHVRPVDVLPSDLPVEGDEESGFLRSEIARLGNDLAFVQQPGDKLRRGAVVAVGSAIWWVLLLLPLLLLAMWRGYLGKLAEHRRDPAGLRRRRALGVARDGLKAMAALPNEAERLAAAARVITGFVAAATDRPEAAVGAPEVRDFCRRLDHENIGEELTAVLAAADTARYGGGDTAETSAELGRRLSDSLSILAAGMNRLNGSPGSVRRESTLRAFWLGLLLCGGLALAPTAPAAQPDRPGVDPVRLVAEGNQAYTAGDLAQARTLYEQAEALGVDDAVLHFNLANVHARQGHLGLAVAGYLRALRLDPRNGDAKANLAWVRSHSQDLELLGGNLPLFIAQLYAFEESLTLGEWSVVFIGAVWLLAGLLAWGWYHQTISPWLRRTLLTVAVMVAVSGAVTGWRYQREEVRRQAVVIAEQVVVRSGPDETFATLFEIHDGLAVTLHDEQDGWARIGLGGDWQGWVPRRDLVLVRREGT